MYFGQAGSIGHLRTFITGFYLGQPLTNSEDILECFTTWVAEHYRVAPGAKSWSIILLEQAGNDDSAAFELFYKHLDSYLDDRAAIGCVGIQARANDNLSGR